MVSVPDVGGKERYGEPLASAPRKSCPVSWSRTLYTQPVRLGSGAEYTNSEKIPLTSTLNCEAQVDEPTR